MLEVYCSDAVDTLNIEYVVIFNDPTNTPAVDHICHLVSLLTQRPTSCSAGFHIIHGYKTPHRSWDTEPVEPDDLDPCAICLDEIEDEAESLACGHVFHAACI